MNVNEQYLEQLNRNSKKQARYRDSMRKKGYIQTTVFIPESCRKELKEFINTLRERYEGSKK